MLEEHKQIQLRHAHDQQQKEMEDGVVARLNGAKVAKYYSRQQQMIYDRDQQSREWEMNRRYAEQYRRRVHIQKLQLPSNQLRSHF